MMLILGILVIFVAGVTLGFGLGLKRSEPVEVHHHNNYNELQPDEKLKALLKVVRDLENGRDHA